MMRMLELLVMTNVFMIENAVMMVMTNVSAVDKLIYLTKQVDCICCTVRS